VHPTAVVSIAHVTARFDLDDSETELIDIFNFLLLGYTQWQWEDDTTYYVLAPSEAVSAAVLAAVVGE
jgi:hypothetical protein